MKKCQKCGFPLEGFLARTCGRILGCPPSKNNPFLCRRCAAAEDAGRKKDAGGRPPSSKTGYICQICNRTVEETTALTHIKAEEYLLELIRKDHPEWKEDKSTCHKCVDYYRELIKKAKI